MSVVGIDFGDESLTVAVARRQGIDVLQNEVGKRKTRSGMSFSVDQRLVGDEMTNQYMSNAANSVVALKRIMGKMFDDPDVQTEQKFMVSKLVPDENGRVGIKLKAFGKETVIAPEQAGSAFLSKIKSVCEMNMEGAKVKDCVIAIPAFFTETQRRAMLDSAVMAGLNPLRLINEPTAIALQYGFYRPFGENENRRVLFYDMGYSATTAFLASFTNKGLKMEAVAFDRHFGGRNIDEMLVEHLAAYIQTKYKLDVFSNTKALLKLRKECDNIKQTLSANTKVPFTIEYLMDGKDVAGMVTRDEFEGLIRTSFGDRILAPLQTVSNGLQPDEIHSLEILGGATRIPFIQNQLRQFLGREVSKTCDGDESICRGATLQCAMLSQSMKVKEYEVKDISAYPIDVEWLPGNPVFTSNGALTDISTSDKVSLFAQFNPIPSTKIVTIKETKLPLQVAARYAQHPTAPTCSSLVARFSISAPQGVVIPDTGKIKLKIRLDPHGVCSLESAQIIEEVEVDEPATPAPDMTDKENPTNTDGAPSPASEGAAATPTATKKKIVKKTDLAITASYPFNLSQKEFRRLQDQDNEFAYKDRIVRETNEARNSLEGYILNMRARVADQNDLGKYFPSSVASRFLDDLKKDENWLEDDSYDAKKEQFEEKLAALKRVGDPALHKHWERAHMNEHVDKFLEVLNKWQKFANTKEERYAHIEAAERAKVTDRCNELSTWVSKQVAVQNNMPAHEDLVLTVADIRNKANELEKFASGIMNKPKPAPPKSAEPKPAESKPADAGAGDAGANDAAAAGAETAGARGESNEEPSNSNPADSAEANKTEAATA